MTNVKDVKDATVSTEWFKIQDNTWLEEHWCKRCRERTQQRFKARNWTATRFITQCQRCHGGNQVA